MKSLRICLLFLNALLIVQLTSLALPAWADKVTCSPAASGVQANIQGQVHATKLGNLLLSDLQATINGDEVVLEGKTQDSQQRVSLKGTFFRTDFQTTDNQGQFNGYCWFGGGEPLCGKSDQNAKEVVHLRKGKDASGTITDINRDQVTVETSEGKLSIPMTDVARIDSPRVLMINIVMPIPTGTVPGTSFTTNTPTVAINVDWPPTTGGGGGVDDVESGKKHSKNEDYAEKLHQHIQEKLQAAKLEEAKQKTVPSQPPPPTTTDDAVPRSGDHTTLGGGKAPIPPDVKGGLDQENYDSQQAIAKEKLAQLQRSAEEDERRLKEGKEPKLTRADYAKKRAEIEEEYRFGTPVQPPKENTGKSDGGKGGSTSTPPSPEQKERAPSELDFRHVPQKPTVPLPGKDTESKLATGTSQSLDTPGQLPGETWADFEKRCASEGRNPNQLPGESWADFVKRWVALHPDAGAYLPYMNPDGATQEARTYTSTPATGTSAERWGAGSAATGSESIAIGATAIAPTANQSVVIGSNTLEQVQNMVVIGLSSDNRTDLCHLQMTCVADEPVTCAIPEYTCFIPFDSKCQIMTKIGDPVVHLAPKQTITIDIATMCVSTKLELPPPQVAQKYKVGPYPDSKVAEAIHRIIETSDELERKGSYNVVPISQKQRAHKIAQLSIWRFLGERGGRPEQAVTEASIRQDLLLELNQNLSAKQSTAIDTFAQRMFQAIRLTLAEARVPN